MLESVCSPNMERAGRAIARLRNRAGMSAEQMALAAWPAAVGKRIASHAWACALVRDRLVVDAEDAIWQKQLFHLSRVIVAKLGELLGEGVVKDVEFRIAVPRRPPQRANALNADAAQQEADGIADPVFRILYREARKKASG